MQFIGTVTSLSLILTPDYKIIELPKEKGAKTREYYNGRPKCFV